MVDENYMKNYMKDYNQRDYVIEKRRAYQKKRRLNLTEKEKEKIRSYMKDYRAKNPEKFKEYEKRRRDKRKKC